MSKRRFTAIVSKAKPQVEEGEEVSPLPYVRLSRRNHRGSSSMTEAEMIDTLAIREISPDRLLATKRIINSFNAGDIEAIREIVFDAAVENCEVYFSNLQHVFLGKLALFSLWTSLFEAYPNGIFRTSDSVINEKKQVYTSFLFFGTKIFPLLIDGLPVEMMTMTNNQCSTSSATGTSNTNNCSSSVIVDRERPLFTTAELLEAEAIPEMVFEGRIVVHLNEHCRIRKFDFAWHRKL